MLTYLAAYLAGLIGFALARYIRPTGWTVLGIILSGFGLVSFLIEGSHWLWSHHLTWIASCPAGCLLLAGVVLVQIGRPPRKIRPSSAMMTPIGGIFVPRTDDWHQGRRWFALQRAVRTPGVTPAM